MQVSKLIIAAALVASLPFAAAARDQIQIVGSSTLFPFSAAVAEQFGKTTDFKTPIVESTGSGGGLKLFCSGVGTKFPDITNASRRIKKSEVERCASNEVHDVVEVKVGYDGIVLANAKSADRYQLSLRDIYLALAKDVPDADGNMVPNPTKTWQDVNPALPAEAIEVLGPPPTSGTRDAFVELAMEGGCKSFEAIKTLKKTDKNAYKAICHSMREDGAFIEAGENDNLIVKKLEANPRALGIFGFSFLDQNADKLQGSLVEDADPSFDNISDGIYPISRALYFYVKKAHVDMVPGLKEFVAEFTNDATWGEDGYLADKGLIPMSDDERNEWSASANGLQNLSM